MHYSLAVVRCIVAAAVEAVVDIAGLAATLDRPMGLTAAGRLVGFDGLGDHLGKSLDSTF